MRPPTNHRNARPTWPQFSRKIFAGRIAIWPCNEHGGGGEGSRMMSTQVWTDARLRVNMDFDSVVSGLVWFLAAFTQANSGASKPSCGHRTEEQRKLKSDHRFFFFAHPPCSLIHGIFIRHAGISQWASILRPEHHRIWKSYSLVPFVFTKFSYEASKSDIGTFLNSETTIILRGFPSTAKGRRNRIEVLVESWRAIWREQNYKSFQSEE